jgi:Spy/CpxP family protein refolding chaperone
MKNKVRSIVIGVSILAIAAVAVYLHGLRRMESMGPQEEIRDGGRILRELGLTAEQKNKLEENRIAQRQQVAFLMASLRQKRAEIEEALRNPAVSYAEVEPISREIKSLQSKLTDLRLDGIFAVKAILIPEQFAKFQRLMKK